MTDRTERAILAGGCFWGMQDLVRRMPGVISTRVGYSGGTTQNATYATVKTGTTGHAEALKVVFDPALMSFRQLLEFFFQIHDPTTTDRQGGDRGSQYRSAIFTHSDEQAKVAAASKQAADASGHFSDPIVTEITPASTFYPAEDYHQEYYQLNKAQPYCRAVIAPKLGKLGLEK